MKLAMTVLYHFFIIPCIVITGCNNKQNTVLDYIDCSTWDGWTNNNGVKCGFLTVPEDHDKQDDRKIRIAFAIKKGTRDNISPPVLYLTGGPGGRALNNMRRFETDSLLEIGDVILVDQRGIGYSSALPDIGETSFEILADDLSREEERQLVRESITTWMTLITNEGIDLGKYNSYQSAKDFGMLMDALDYEKYNIWAGSYGTRLSAVIMKYFPEKINAAVLTSPAPLDNNALVNRIPAFENSLSSLFAECKENPQCAKRHKDLKNLNR